MALHIYLIMQWLDIYACTHGAPYLFNNAMVRYICMYTWRYIGI